MRVGANEADVKRGRDAHDNVASALARTEAAGRNQAAAKSKEGALEQEAIEATRMANPLNDGDLDRAATLQARFATLRAVNNRKGALCAALHELVAALRAARPVIEDLAQDRSVEEVNIFACSWFAVLESLSLMTIESKIENCQRVARQVLSDFEVLLSKQVWGTITNEEFRCGYLRDANGGGGRPLTATEKRLVSERQTLAVLS